MLLGIEAEHYLGSENPLTVSEPVLKALSTLLSIVSIILGKEVVQQEQVFLLYIVYVKSQHWCNNLSVRLGSVRARCRSSLYYRNLLNDGQSHTLP